MVYFFLEWLGAYKRRKEQGFFFNSFLLQSFHFFLLNFQKGENWCNILKKCLSIHSIHFSLPRWMRFIASLSKYQTFVYAFQFSSSNFILLKPKCLFSCGLDFLNPLQVQALVGFEKTIKHLDDRLVDIGTKVRKYPLALFCITNIGGWLGERNY